MKAAVLDENGLRFDDAYQATPLPEEVSVRVSLAGICETDLQLVQGYMNFRGVPGHEFAGVVEEGPLTGKRVTAEINCGCHDCDYCRDGLANHCPHRTVIGIFEHDGAFAEIVYVPARNLHLVPDEVSDREAVFAEPLAAAFQIGEQVKLTDHKEVAVIGDGRMAFLIAQVLRLQGLHVTVVGKHENKLQRFQSLGLETFRLESAPARRRFSLAVDCTGSPTGIPTALQFLRPRGTLVLKTTTSDATGPPLAPVVIDEIQIVGSRCGPFPPALQALQAKEVSVEPLVTATFPLNDVNEAFVAAASPQHGKVLLAPGG